MNILTSTTLPVPEPAASGRLTARIVRVEGLEQDTVGEMWQIFSRYYEAVSRTHFEHDLREKSIVILATDSGDDSLRGFSTVQILRRRIAGRRIVAVFSGDTIIDPGYWGQRTLQRAFLRVLVAVKVRAPATPLYWFLISKGYKTYLLLARNFQHFWPRRGHVTPHREAEIIESLALEKFGAGFSRDLGVFRAGNDSGRVRGGVAPLTTGLLDDPDIRFFANRNPRHAAGDELCCLGKFDLMTCWRAFAKLFGRNRP